MDFIGNALRCFEGRGTSYEGLPKLGDCKEYGDVCASEYAKTDIYSEHGLELTAGSWYKACFKKSYFRDWLSDRCIEIKKHVKVCYINPCFIY